MSILNCIGDQSCSTQVTKSDIVTYIGLDLLCTNIQTSEDLSAVLVKIDERLCSITDTLSICCTTTTTSTSTSTTTTTTECPCTTTTTTVPPTTTTTTTAVHNLPTCVILVNKDAKVYAYNAISNILTFLGNYAPGGNDIANTDTKMWLYNETQIYEYDITLSPWTAVFNRIITIPAGVKLGKGLCAVSDRVLVGSNTFPGGVTAQKLILIDIAAPLAVVTDILPLLPSGTSVSGDILFTTTNKLIVTTTKGGVDQLRQYDALTNNLEVTVDLPSFNEPYGLFEDTGSLYIFTGFGSVRSVDLTYPYALTVVNETGLYINGASQQPDCIDVNLITTTTTTSTSSTTTTSTSTTSTTTTTTTLTPTTTTTTTIFPFPTALICGSQWVTENLNVVTYRNGDVIPQVQDQTQWASLTTGAWCYYNNDSATGTTYGRLYNWYAVNDPRGLAPNGYHIPSDAEWTNMINCLGGKFVAGGALKEAGFSHWATPNTGATNSTGFNGLPGGNRANDGVFLSITFLGFWWTASEYDLVNAYPAYIRYDGPSIYQFTQSKKRGFSVRLIKD